MLKAQLIDHVKYYKLRRKGLALMFLSAIPFGFIANIYQVSILYAIPIIGLYLAFLSYEIRNLKLMNTFFGNKKIEIDQDEIRINTKKGNPDETIKLKDLTKIILRDEYSMPQESIKAVGEELAGRTTKNFLILQKNDQKRRLDFEFDSYYMINQLNKLIESWKINGYNIERRSQNEPEAD